MDGLDWVLFVCLFVVHFFFFLNQRLMMMRHQSKAMQCKQAIDAASVL
jgi:hypothetical protein